MPIWIFFITFAFVIILELSNLMSGKKNIVLVLFEALFLAVLIAGGVLVLFS